MVSPYEEDGLITHILLYNSVPVVSSLFLPKHCPPAGLWPLRGITNYLETTALTAAAEFSWEGKNRARTVIVLRV